MQRWDGWAIRASVRYPFRSETRALWLGGFSCWDKLHQIATRNQLNNLWKSEWERFRTRILPNCWKIIHFSGGSSHTEGLEENKICNECVILWENIFLFFGRTRHLLADGDDDDDVLSFAIIWCINFKAIRVENCFPWFDFSAWFPSWSRGWRSGRELFLWFWQSR